MNTSIKIQSFPQALTGLIVTFVVMLFTTPGSWASSLEIERASISFDGNTLRVSGKDAPDFGAVTVVYPDDGTFIGSTQADNEGDWSLVIPTPDPAPCRVRAESNNGSDERNVRRAPTDCSNNGGGGGGNNAPVANNDSYSTAQDTVLDVARLVHREIADKLKFARVWGKSVFDGQQCGPEHPVEDGDVVEFLFSG